MTNEPQRLPTAHKHTISFLQPPAFPNITFVIRRSITVRPNAMIQFKDAKAMTEPRETSMTDGESRNAIRDGDYPFKIIIEVFHEDCTNHHQNMK